MGPSSPSPAPAFSDASGASFAGNAASFTIVSDTSITATSPAGTAGTVDITVTNETGTSSTSSADHFTYDATPSVTGITPVAGPIAGGTVVTITGTGFADASGASFAGNAASYTIVSDTSITATTPARDRRYSRCHCHQRDRHLFYGLF